MSDALFIILLILVGLTLDFLWVAFTRRTRKGKLQISNNSADLRVTSDVGFFKFSGENSGLAYAFKGKRGSLSFSDIAGLKLVSTEQSAFGLEFINGFSVTDLLPRYADKMIWKAIVIKAASGEEIPIYTVGQYLPREFLLTWYIDLQAHILSQLGLFKDINIQVDEALVEIQSNFKTMGLNWQLC